MKLFITAILLFSISAATSAQSLEDGKKYFYYERLASANNVFHSVLKQDPANAEAWYWLVRNYLLIKDSVKAADSLALAPASILEQPFFLVAKGALLLNKNNGSAARLEFQKAIDDTKAKNTSILAAVADVEIESPNGDVKYAIGLLQNALKRDKKNPALYTSLGKAYRKMHDGTAAYQAFKEAIDKDKNAASAYYELGNIFLSQKNVEMYTDFFRQAIEADKQFGPAYYALYEHWLYRDPSKADDYFLQYVANADKSLRQDYSYTDLLYLTKKYDSAILSAKKLIQVEGADAPPRLYKLIAYSYQEKKDSSGAFNYMRQYFEKEVDSNLIVKDYETMGLLFAEQKGREDSAIAYFEKAVSLSADTGARVGYYRQLARLSKQIDNYEAEASWMGKLYAEDPRANNITLFNWGLAAYKARDYQQSDSVFALYTAKYPDQGFGYYWRARANAAIDTTMEQGLAIAHYQKLVDVIGGDTLSDTDKKWMKEAFGYLAGYAANTEKDYPEAIGYFEKLLEIDPTDEQVQRNIEILEKSLEMKSKTADGSSQ